MLAPLDPTPVATAEGGLPAAAAIRKAVANEPLIDAAALVAILARHGSLTRFLEPFADGGYRYAAPWRDALEELAAIGGADLSLGRLLEGHLNALELVALYGDREQQARALSHARAGEILGVWGADAQEPTRLVEGEPARLSGAKRYASGVGIVRLALVPVNAEDGTPQLLLLDVAESERIDPSTWNHRGMRRTVSGTHDFEGMVVRPGDRVGRPGDYRIEPHFVGGIWRCAAAQLGAVEAITKAIASDLSSSGRDQHPLQMGRVGTAILASRTARLWVEDAARRVSACAANAPPSRIDHAVSLSAYARLATEKAAMEVIDLAERAIGLGSFALAHPVEALTRDLSVYVRQANPDAVLLQHGRILARELLS